MYCRNSETRLTMLSIATLLVYFVSSLQADFTMSSQICGAISLFLFFIFFILPNDAFEHKKAFLLMYLAYCVHFSTCEAQCIYNIFTILSAQAHGGASGV